MSVESSIHHDRRSELRAYIDEYLHPTSVESEEAREGRLFMQKIAYLCTPFVLSAFAAIGLAQLF